ncbi:unnamed protein product [Rhizophagus irregularis]|nr:unnamed protein product [Rhizophagus irregularis]
MSKASDYRVIVSIDFGTTYSGFAYTHTKNDCWKVNFFTQVLLVFTIPAEFDDNAILIMRECAYKAGLLKDQFARNVKFITEPEAAAIHCMKSFKEHNLSVGANFMIVDCGGGTVDLTTRQLLEGETLSEITERSGDYCGGSFVDQEFLKFLESKVGANAISKVRENHYCQLQYMVQEFVRVVKMKFTGDPSGYEDTELELDDICPVIKQYCKGEYLDKMEEVEWIKLISIPPQPVIAVIRGAVEYGLREEVVSTRVLKWTYGTDVARKWRDGDPIDRRLGDGRIIAFERLVKRGTQVNVNDKVYQSFISYDATQRRMGLDLYVTPQDDAKFCDDPDVKTLGNWSVELPDSTNDDDRSILFTMIFGNVEIDVTAYNSGTEAMFDTKFNLDM